MSRTRATLSVVFLALTAACQAPASRQSVPMPDQGVELEQPGNARVYVIRRDQTVWSRWPLLVYDEGRELASLAAGGYLCWETGPGRMLARLVLDRNWTNGGPTERLYDVTLEPGAVVWVAVGVDGQSGMPQPERLEAEAGRALVAASRPAMPR